MEEEDLEASPTSFFEFVDVSESAGCTVVLCCTYCLLRRHRWCLQSEDLESFLVQLVTGS